MERSRLAAETLRDAVHVSTVSVPCNRRKLPRQPPTLPHCETEEDAVDLSLRRAFGLTEPLELVECAKWNGTPQRLLSYAGAKPPVYVLSGPGPAADGRRGGIGDGYIA